MQHKRTFKLSPEQAQQRKQMLNGIIKASFGRLSETQAANVLKAHKKLVARSQR